jgi:hypothetical protein
MKFTGVNKRMYHLQSLFEHGCLIEMIPEIRCQLASATTDMASYPKAPATLISNQIISGRCPAVRWSQRRFANGATTEFVKCSVIKTTGVLVHQPSNCKGK